MNVLFSNEGWEDYQYWQANDIKLLKKSMTLLRILRETQIKA